MILRVAYGILAAATLAACSSSPLSILGGSPSLPEARCRAAGADAQLGKTIDDETAENARAEAGAMRSRVLRYGGIPTTMVNNDPQRLNIEVDETGKIRRLRCG